MTLVAHCHVLLTTTSIRKTNKQTKNLLTPTYFTYLSCMGEHSDEDNCLLKLPADK